MRLTRKQLLWIQAEHGDPDEYIDNATGITVYSVYRRNPEQIASILQTLEADIIISDFQVYLMITLDSTGTLTATRRT